MTGWHVLVFRKGEEGAADARLAVWQTDFNGLDWLDRLVDQGKAAMSGGGYPLEYLVSMEHARPFILSGPPNARKRWLSEPSVKFSEQWTGRTMVDWEAMKAVEASAMILIKAWDES